MKTLRQRYSRLPHSMKVLISFHESSDVEPHIADIDIVPRQGDMLDLPDISSQHLYPVERVIFQLTRPQGGKAMLEVSKHGVAIGIQLGPPVAK